MAKKWIVKEALGLLGWLVLTFAAAAVGAVASASSGVFMGNSRDRHGHRRLGCLDRRGAFSIS